MKSKSKRKPKTRQYPVHYLAIILLAFLFFESTLMSMTTPNDWKAGVSILDISEDAQQMPVNTASFFQPMADQFTNINIFYTLAADEMMRLLDISESVSDLTVFNDGITSFYEQASDQMMALLDAHAASDRLGAVGGISISR